MRKRPVAFDLDGTLYQTDMEAIPAYIEAFTELIEQKVIDTMPSQTKLGRMFGMTSTELWPYLMPEASEEVRQLAAQTVKKTILKYRGQGKLFPGVMQVLTQLADQGHPLIVVSNGNGSHVTGTCNRCKLTSLLTGIYAAGDYGTGSKIKLLECAVRELDLIPGMMVGDRNSDIEAGAKNGFVTVGCIYGFGQREELAAADYHIDDIREIIDLVNTEGFVSSQK